jgi:hypothetical protein
MKMTSWIAWMLSSIIVLLWLGSASASLVISIEPAVTEAELGDTIDIAVHAEGPDWVGWYWCEIHTSADVLTYLECSTDILQGCPSGWNCMFCGPGTPGVFKADCACFGVHSCVEVPGDLIIITYIVTGEGISPVSFEFFHVSDCDRNDIPLDAVIDGSVVVGNASVDPWNGHPDLFVGSLTGFPNPFRHGVTLEFQVAAGEGDWGGEPRRSEISIFDCMGREVRGLEVMLSPGEHTITWDGLDWQGRCVPSGIYFCRYPVEHGFGTYKITRVD